MNLNKYRDEAFRIATSHGFHDEKYSVEHWICLIISELMEAVEADRKGFRADLDAYEKYATRISFDENFERHIKDTIEDELSDACIRIFDLAGENNIDLDFSGSESSEISPDAMFTEKIMVVCQFILGTTKDTKNLYVYLNYSLTLIFTIARQLGVDIKRHIEMKMWYNDGRPFRHHKQY